MLIQAPATLIVIGLTLVVGAIHFLEAYFPLRKTTGSRLRHLGINLAIGTVSSLGLGLVVWVGLRPWTQSPLPASGGLIPWLQAHWGAPFWMTTLLSVLLLDWTWYGWHRLAHRSRWFWRFHRMHHRDLQMDASTGFRFHWGELLIAGVIRILQVYLIGPALAVWLIFETTLTLASLMQHSNLKLPTGIEKGLMKIFVTPRYHRIHHLRSWEETDSNLGVIFSFWDALHGTRNLNRLDQVEALPTGSPDAHAGDELLPWRTGFWNSMKDLSSPR
jgi:sterol desaturase/sphingolipid hydroxylase (fatty acid hydroxylase superfamily)